MCLILFAWQSHPRYPLIVAANREEFHERPTESAKFWPEHPDLLAGRDLQAGGTWLGVTRQGRFAAITNYREPLVPTPPSGHSRGHLVRDFLAAESSPQDHAAQLQVRGATYQGFNLLLGEPGGLVYFSNRSDHPVSVPAGVHGLSNHLLDTDWPKVHSGRDFLASLLDQDRVYPEALFGMLTDRKLMPGRMPADFENSDLPEQLMRHYFIVSPVYGTRSSTVLLADHEGNVEFLERQFGPAGESTGTKAFKFRIDTG